MQSVSPWRSAVNFLLNPYRCVLCCSHAGPVSGSTVMHALQERLLGNYSVLVRPVVSEADAVEVNVTVHLMQVFNLVSLCAGARTCMYE